MFKDFSGELAEGEAVGFFGWAGFEDRTGFVEPGEMAREFKEVIAQEVRTIFVGSGFESDAEVHQVACELKLVRVA